MPQSKAVPGERIPQIVPIVLRQANKQYQQGQISAAHLKAVIKRVRRELDDMGWELLESHDHDGGAAYRVRCRQSGVEMELSECSSEDSITESDAS